MLVSGWSASGHGRAGKAKPAEAGIADSSSIRSCHHCVVQLASKTGLPVHLQLPLAGKFHALAEEDVKRRL